MKKAIYIFQILLFSFLLTIALVSEAQMGKMHKNESNTFKTASANELRTNLRTLWEDHAMYTRNVILNIIDDLPGTEAAVARLLKNQDDIGNAIKPLYGDVAGKKLSELLREHILIAADLLKAAKLGRQDEFGAANSNWIKNGNDIAAFLSAANPENWKPEEMKKMMNEHLRLTTGEAVARLNKDYVTDIEAYDKTRAELMEMSDMLAIGIIRQFPEKFKK